MTLPLSSPFVSLTKVTKLQLDQLVAAINALPFGFIGESINTTGGPAMTTVGTYYAGGPSCTFTLATQRRVRIFVTGTPVTASGAPAHYGLRAVYTPGATVGAQTTVGSTSAITNGVAGGSSANSGPTEGTVLLAAGTYTAFVAAARTSGGAATDALNNSYVSVYDVGAV